MAAAPTFALDHLVVGTSSLAVGRRWCEETFGVAAQPGGVHATMGTHNVLLSLASSRFPRAYLEIIAIDPDAPAPAQARWFDLDRPALRERIAIEPTLLHWVARADDVDAAAAWLKAAGHDIGAVTASERMTARGPLRWRITLRPDGCRPADGAVPLLIDWPAEHPTDVLPPSGVTVESMRLGGIAPALALALGSESTGESEATVAVPLQARLLGPLGPLTLSAPPALG